MHVGNLQIHYNVSATCRYTIMYLGFHIECEPRDRERVMLRGWDIEEQHRSGRALGPT